MGAPLRHLAPSPLPRSCSSWRTSHASPTSCAAIPNVKACACGVTGDGRAALDAVTAERPAVVLLDVGLPDMDGTEVCRRMRSAHDWTPVLFVTARDDEVDRVLCLELVPTTT